MCRSWLKAPCGRRVLLVSVSSYTLPAHLFDLPAVEARAPAVGGGAMSTPARRRLIRDFKKLQQVGFVGGARSCPDYSFGVG